MLVADALGKVADRRIGRRAAAGRHAAMPDRRPVRLGPGRRLGLAVGPGHRLRGLLDRRLGTRAFGRRVPTASRRAFRPWMRQPSLIAMPRVARGVLLATMVLPVLAITVLAALLQIGGAAPGGPRCQDVLRRPSGRRGRILCRWHSVIGALVGYALRERSSGYAFSAGPGAGDGRRAGLCAAHHVGRAALRRDILRHADPTLCHHGRRLGHRVADRSQTVRRLARSSGNSAFHPGARQTVRAVDGAS